MNIMTFNTQHCLNYIERKIDFPLMAGVIRRLGADIAGLNEIRAKGPSNPDFEDQTEILSELTGLPYYYFARAIDVKDGGPYGNAILSRYPIAEAETIPIPDPDVEGKDRSFESRCLLRARLANGITVLVTHFGLNASEQACAARTVAEHLEESKCILMGDFNVRPDSGILAPIRERMKDAADAFPGPLFSRPSDDPDRKIDYLFVSRDIEVLSADIPAIVASDHRPHTAVIRVEGLEDAYE